MGVPLSLKGAVSSFDPPPDEDKSSVPAGSLGVVGAASSVLGAGVAGGVVACAAAG